jgi:hypothetical protein
LVTVGRTIIVVLAVVAVIVVVLAVVAVVLAVVGRSWLMKFLSLASALLMASRG